MITAEEALELTGIVSGELHEDMVKYLDVNITELAKLGYHKFIFESSKPFGEMVKRYLDKFGYKVEFIPLYLSDNIKIKITW